jgi:uncharacterized protein (TIGR02145 family)
MIKNELKHLLTLLLTLFFSIVSHAQSDSKALYTKGKGLTYQGHNYSTVVMGNGQEWMAENLRVFYFRNGDPIPIVKTDEVWKEAGENGEPACCYYENNAEYGKTYGVLYNWYAVNDPRGLAPEGWHVPMDNEWTTLKTFLGNDAVVKLKSTIGWSIYEAYVECTGCKSWTAEQKAGQVCNICNDSRNTKAQISGNGTNESGFSGLPGGNRFGSGKFDDIGNFGYWWSAKGDKASLACYYWLHGISFTHKSEGFYVRCIKD